MKELKYSFIVKVMSYVVAPILLIMTLVSLFSIFYIAEEPETIKVSKFEETNVFADLYKNRLRNLYYNYEEKAYSLEDEITSTDILIEDSANSNIYYDSYLDYFSDSLKYIVETPTGKIYTNIKELSIDNLEQMKEKTAQNKVYWINNKEGIITTLNLENSHIYNQIKNSENNIYTYLEENWNRDYYCIEELMYDVAKNTHNGVIIYLPLGAIGLVIVCIYIFCSVGHKPGKEGIYLNSFDKLQLEVAVFIIGIFYAITVFLTFGMVNIVYNITSQIAMGFIGAILIYLVSILAFETILRRVKSHTLLKNSICYKILNKVIEIAKNIKITIRVAIAYFLFGLFTTILILNIYEDWSMLLLFGLWISCGIYILNRVMEYNKIRKFIQNLYEGTETEKLNEDEFKGELKNLVPKLNDIASGFSKAVEKGIQSERLKTELITNVSHDIKTPLTSIINYVDLMKKEEISNNKLKEYLEVIDKKSQRLKKLTEDLVEASKASSGNIKLNKENLKLKELIVQEMGEFDEKFKVKGLQIIENFSKAEMIINADGKYMSRILDNVFSNISKYALPNSRVYIDATIEDEKIKVSFKNISANQLNITADELMERFVRGDVSRTTEGSGLGLSIAKSLTELQGGTFEIYLDGDLFKVEIGF